MDINWLFTSKKKWLTGVILILVVSLVTAGCGLRANSNKPQQNEQNEVSTNGKRQLVLSSERSQVLIYFATTDKEYLLPVTIDINPTKEVAKVAVEKLLAGPNNDFIASTIPEGTKLRDIYFSENSGTVYVDLTNEFLNLNNEEEVLLALASLTYTLTELPQVKRVQLSIDGETIKELHGVSLGRPLEREHGVNFVGQPEDGQEEIRVFFGDENAMFLVPLTIGIPADLSVPEKAQEALKALVQGPPKDSSLSPVLWKGTKILNVDWHETEKLLTVDFSKEFVGYGGGSAFEKQLVGSLVYTLTGLPEVEKLQILIEGEKWDYLPEGTDIYKPLTKSGRGEKFNYSQPN